MLEADAAAAASKQAALTAVATKWQEDDVNVDCDSYGSLETLSDTVSITIDGEKHWVSGVDANTTCADLICALLLYQNLEHRQHGAQLVGGGNKVSLTNTKEHQTEAVKDLKNTHEYVIVKQLRHCQFEEYLDGSTRLLDVLPLKDNLARKQCELQLRNLARATPVPTALRAAHHTQMFAMLSDKDSGMGSPVGSSRSERFRRRRGKQRQAAAMELYRADRLEQADNVDKSKEQKSANPNERLMNIILAQDETINRQMYLLNEKEQQILKIEHEKHCVRERELGKNYLLDAYLNAWDKQPDISRALPDVEEQSAETRTHFIKDATQISPGMPNRIESSPQPDSADTTLPEDMQIYWLEKVYALNKQLQREEEQLLRLHAKVRKQQVRHAYHTKGEVLQQIDRLDTELSTQVADIYRVERQLLTANEQLKAKLGVLECLGREFETTECETNAKSLNFQQNVQHLRQTIEKPTQNDAQFADKSKLPQHLIEKNSNSRVPSDAKLMQKQMFSPNKTEPVYALISSKHKLCTESAQYNEAKANILAKLDIEHLGTLV